MGLAPGGYHVAHLLRPGGRRDAIPTKTPALPHQFLVQWRLSFRHRSPQIKKSEFRYQGSYGLHAFVVSSNIDVLRAGPSREGRWTPGMHGRRVVSATPVLPSFSGSILAASCRGW